MPEEITSPECTRDTHCGCSREPVLKAKTRTKCGYAVACASLYNEANGPNSPLRYKHLQRVQTCRIIDNTVDPFEYRDCTRTIEFDDSFGTSGYATADCQDEGGAPSCGDDQQTSGGCDEAGLYECAGFPPEGFKCFEILSEVLTYSEPINLDDQEATALAAGAWVEDAEFTEEAFTNIHGAGVSYGEMSSRIGWTVKRFGPRVPWQIKYKIIELDDAENETETVIVLAMTASENEAEITDLEESASGVHRAIEIIETHFGRNPW